jgi:hypothetical protein
MNAEFEQAFVRLRGILRKHAATLTVTEDTPVRYCVEGGLHPTHNRPLPLAWVQIGKSYVSFHHMGLDAALYESLSPSLLARRQGKTCFNLRVADEALLEEPQRLTTEAFESLRRAGYLPGR